MRFWYLIGVGRRSITGIRQGNLMLTNVANLSSFYTDKARQAFTRATGVDWHIEKLLPGETSQRVAVRHCEQYRNYAVAAFDRRFILSITRRG